MKFAKESYEKEIINHPLIKHIRSFEKKQIEKVLFELPKHWRVLEVGCANGFYTHSLVQHFQKVSALDRSNEFFSEWNVPNIKPIEMNFFDCSKEFIENFDLIVLIGVYEFISKSEEKVALERFSWAPNIVIVSASADFSSFIYRATHLWKNKYLLNPLNKGRISRLRSLKKFFFEKRIFPHNKIVAMTSEFNF